MDAARARTRSPSAAACPSEPFEVEYELSQDEDFHAIVRKGSTVALPDEAHSARAEIQGLGPEHEYYYRFRAGSWISPVGRTRTRPNGNSMVRSLTFAFVSCQNFAEGYFTPYDEIAASEDIETVIFLGDYIYEGRNSAVRTHEPQMTIQTLDDYRIRHGQYKTDPALQRAHAAHPWLITWDDHEFANNYADDDLDQTPPVPAEQVLARRAAAYRAFWEHMPLARARKPVGPDLQLYRRFRWGQMATFNVLDGRQYRSDQNATCARRDPSGYCVEHLDPSRTMLGAEQRDWLLEDLAGTKARWNVLAQQTAFAPLNGGLTNPPRFSGANADNWEGYVAERQRIIDWAVEHETPNFVVLTGDSHRNWVRNIPRHYSSLENPMGVEFLGTSVSTGGDPRSGASCDFGLPNNPQLLLRTTTAATASARSRRTRGRASTGSCRRCGSRWPRSPRSRPSSSRTGCRERRAWRPSRPGRRAAAGPPRGPSRARRSRRGRGSPRPRRRRRSRPPTRASRRRTRAARPRRRSPRTSGAASASTLTGLPTASQTARISSALARPGRVEHVRAGGLVGLQARDRVVEVGVAADVVLRARGQREREAEAARGVGRGGHALDRMVGLVEARRRDPSPRSSRRPRRPRPRARSPSPRRRARARSRSRGRRRPAGRSPPPALRHVRRQLVERDLAVAAPERERERRARRRERLEPEPLEHARRAGVPRVGDHERLALVQRAEALAALRWVLMTPATP